MEDPKILELKSRLLDEIDRNQQMHGMLNQSIGVLKAISTIAGVEIKDDNINTQELIDVITKKFKPRAKKATG